MKAASCWERLSKGKKICPPVSGHRECIVYWSLLNDVDLVTYDRVGVVFAAGSGDDPEDCEDREDGADHDGDDPADDGDPEDDQGRTACDEHHDAVVNVVSLVEEILIGRDQKSQEPEGAEVGHYRKSDGCAGYIFDRVAFKMVLRAGIAVVHVDLPYKSAFGAEHFIGFE